MMKVCIFVREAGGLKPDFSLEFDLPAIPKPGDYVSIQRPDEPAPYGEDMIVEQVWWRLKHMVTAAFESQPREAGTVAEIVVECSPAIGPWSSDKWKDSLKDGRERGDVGEFQIARLSVRQDSVPKAKSTGA
jgi:hypothetical protein